MFSGIISHQGKVVALDTDNQDSNNENWSITIETDLEASRCKPGASIACNGICLTVVKLNPSQHSKLQFLVQAGATTRQHTTLASWSVGRIVNLESSLRLGDPLDGHLVTGHVDACVSVAKRSKRENEIGLDFFFPQPPPQPPPQPSSEDKTAEQLRACCAVRGSVALDGVSLTISACDDKAFSTAVIPYTAEHTTLGALVEGERVNLEVDLLARYVERRLAIMQNKP